MNSPLNILSLGAGVQSTAVALMSADGELPKIDHCIFADTQWEPKAVYDHLDWLVPVLEKADIPVHIVTRSNIKQDALMYQVRGMAGADSRWGSMPFHTYCVVPAGSPIYKDQFTDAEGHLFREETLDTFGDDEGKEIIRYTTKETISKGIIRRQCTSEYKIAPIEKKIREILGYEPGQRISGKTVLVRHWFGISADEAGRIRFPEKRYKENFYPLCGGEITRKGNPSRGVLEWKNVSMSRADCISWCLMNGYPEPPRSACKGCPFHSNMEWKWLRDNAPEDFADAVAFDNAIRNCGGMRGKVYLHSSCKPLDEIDLDDDVDRGQMQFSWMSECSGNCGV